MAEQSTVVGLPDLRSPAEIVASLDLRTYQGPQDCGVVTAVQLTQDNIGAVWEWADSKPRYRGTPEPGGQPVCVGLTLRPGGDRVPAYFGDWVVQSRSGQFFRFPADEFATRFTPVAVEGRGGRG